MLQIEAARRVLEANDYLEVFGGGSGDKEELLRFIRGTYRQLARELHPDRTGDRPDARAAFERLTALRKEAEEAVGLAKYGRPVVLATITTKRGSHHVRRSTTPGDITSTYYADSAVNGVTQPTLVKVAKNAADNDLLKVEAAALRRLHADGVDTSWTAFVPILLDSFQMTQPRGPRRAANAIGWCQDCYSLVDVKKAYENLEPVHAVWIWRKLLVALGFAHDNGVVHGAALPPHVMIHPEHHGLVLVDWCYASLQRDDAYPALTAMVAGYRDWYPSEVSDKRPPSPATDIALAVRTIVWLLGGDPIHGTMPRTVPLALRAFFRGCLSTSQSARPQNAWLLLQEFDELLESMGAPYYPRRFRTFTMPTGLV